MKPPVGSGLPEWLDTALYLSADETRREPPRRFASRLNHCLLCGNPAGPPTFRLEGAHVARKQMGGQKNGGPTVEACYECHQGVRGIDRAGDRTLAIRRRDRLPVLLTRTGESVKERELHW